MNRSIIFFIALDTLSTLTYAGSSTNTQDCAHTEILDIHSVVSIKTADAPNFDCGSTSEEMIYKDSSGELHRLVYQVVSKSCQW